MSAPGAPERGGQPEIGTRQMPDIPQTNVRAYNHHQLKDAVDAARPGDAASLSTSWSALGAQMTSFATSLSATANNTEAKWKGAAGNEARTALLALASWSDTTGTGLQSMGGNVDTQSTAASEVQKAMPEKVPEYNAVDYYRRLLTSSPFEWPQIAQDARDHYDRYQAAEARAHTAASAYSSTLTESAATMPAFAPPPAIGGNDEVGPGKVKPPPGGVNSPGGGIPHSGLVPQGGGTTNLTSPTNGPTGHGAPPIVAGPGPTFTPPTSGGPSRPPTPAVPNPSGPPRGPGGPGGPSGPTVPGFPGGPGLPPGGLGFTGGGTRPGRGYNNLSGPRGTGIPGGFGGPGGAGGPGQGGGAVPRGGAAGPGFGPGGAAGLLAEDGPHGRPGAGGSGVRGAGAGAGGAPFGPAGVRGNDEDKEHKRPSYLVESEDVWGDITLVAPPVIGEAPPEHYRRGR